MRQRYVESGDSLAVTGATKAPEGSSTDGFSWEKSLQYGEESPI